MRISLLLFLLIINCPSKAQKKYLWKELLEEMSSSDTTDLVIGEKDEITIPSEKVSFRTWEKTKLSEGRLRVNRRVTISYPRLKAEAKLADLSQRYFGIDEPYLPLDSLLFRKNFKIEVEEKRVVISSCIFNQGAFITCIKGKENNVALFQNEFTGSFWFQVSGYAYVLFGYNKVNNEKREVFRKGNYPMATNFTGSNYLYHVLDTLKIRGGSVLSEASNILVIDFRDCPTIWVRDNKFNVEHINNLRLGFQNSKDVNIIDNEFGPSLFFYGSVDTQFKLSRNKFKKELSLFDIQLPSHSIVDWRDVKDGLSIMKDSVVILHQIPAKYYIDTGGKPLPAADSVYSDSLHLGFWYNSNGKEALRNELLYNRMTEVYKMLFDLYKSKGDLKSSNGAFVSAKNLEGDRLEIIFKDNGGFKNYFSWKLNRLLKFYTNHATEPALALVISIYILLGFAVFYFFFPSEWDVETKRKLIQHYKDFVQKNEKGYVKPFFRMVLGFCISFINALTLSLNSFVTLGFGNIPTKGMARYVCIVQGFIGWFLLSIFTVALFNQVLF